MLRETANLNKQPEVLVTLSWQEHLAGLCVDQRAAEFIYWCQKRKRAQAWQPHRWEVSAEWRLMNVHFVRQVSDWGPAWGSRWLRIPASLQLLSVTLGYYCWSGQEQMNTFFKWLPYMCEIMVWFTPRVHPYGVATTCLTFRRARNGKGLWKQILRPMWCLITWYNLKGTLSPACLAK